MKTKSVNNTKLGLFVVAGVLFMILTLYMIGKNRNLFGNTFVIRAVVTNVNGLVPGNNVRFKGIDVGTVEGIELANDSSIIVTLVIDEKMKPFIRSNAIVSIGTDGLMGNKLININSQSGSSLAIRAGDTLSSRKPIETDEMLRTLNTTNTNIEKISRNLYEITARLNNNNGLWDLLSDSVLSNDIKRAAEQLRTASENTSDLTRKGNEMMTRLEDGDGLVNTLFTDTTLSQDAKILIGTLSKSGKRLSATADSLTMIINGLRTGEGSAGLILSDTIARNSLLKSIRSIEEGTSRFNQNMEALKSNFLFRGYFKKLEKESRKK
jgi:phospholipid/cholesterol/gamma-HCH transport system substrate-binding protein